MGQALNYVHWRMYEVLTEKYEWSTRNIYQQYFKQNGLLDSDKLTLLMLKQQQQSAACLIGKLLLILKIHAKINHLSVPGDSFIIYLKKEVYL